MLQNPEARYPPESSPNLEPPSVWVRNTTVIGHSTTTATFGFCPTGDYFWSTNIRGLEGELATLTKGAFTGQEKGGRPKVSLGWPSPWRVTLFPSVLRRCWLGDGKGIRPVKMLGDVGMLLVMTWLASVVTVSSVILSCDKIQNGHILVPAYLHCPRQWLAS